MAEGTKERILRIALELFAQNGYLGTSMNEITWQPYAADAKNVDAAYIRIRNNGEAASEIALKSFKAISLAASPLEIMAKQQARLL